MKLNQASKISEDLFEQSTKKSEKKIYQKVLGVLNHLAERDLTVEQLQSIEEKIDGLNLTAHTETMQKDFKRSSMEFMKFLRDHLSLISEGHYTALYISLGVSFGVAFGAGLQSTSGDSSSIGAGIGVGMAIGMAMGKLKDGEAERQNRVLISRLKV